MRSRAYIDFVRQWYHTRTKVKCVSLEGYSNAIINTSSQFEDRVCSRIEANKFLDILDDTNRQILELRLNKISYEEIAEKLGFKTQSAVIKRIKCIGELYQKYLDKQK